MRFAGQFDRREFLQTAVAAAVPLSDLVCPELDCLSALTDEIGRTPEDSFEFARQYGLRWVELRAVPGSGTLYAELPRDELLQLKQTLDDRRLGVSFLNTWILKITLPGTEPLRRRQYPLEEWQRRLRSDEQRFERRLDDLRQAIEAAHILGVRLIRVFTFWRVASPLPLFERIASILAEMADLAERNDIQLLIENESACNVATSAELARIMGLLPSLALGINWDPHNALPFEPQPFPRGYRLLPLERIGNVQIKGESLLIEGELLDWAAIMRTMQAEGYRGKFGLETHFGTGDVRIRNAHASMHRLLAALR